MVVSLGGFALEFGQKVPGEIKNLYRNGSGSF